MCITRLVSHILVLSLLTTASLCLHVGAVAPLHNFAWCKDNMVCLNPQFPVMGMYFETGYGYSCTCSVSEGTCSGPSGQAYCLFASANVNCAVSFRGETEATTARSEYNTCIACNTGYQLSNDPNPSYECWACSVAVPNCAHCSSEGVCDGCNVLYTLASSGKTCYACNITGCSSCTADNVCGTCSTGYSLSADQTSCYTCGISGCSRCSADGVCDSCEAAHTLSSDMTSCFSCGITGCTACTAHGICGTCEPDHTLSTDGKSCIPCAIEACLSCSSSGVCAVCASGYKLSGTSGTCKKSGIPWWVWLIVGLVVAAAIVAVIIIVCCCCCEPRVTPPHAEEERSTVDVNPLSDAAPLVEFDDAKDTSTTQLQRVPSSRVRRVSLGGEIVLDATHPGLPQFPSSRSILPVPAAAEHQPLIPQQPQREDNSSNWQADSVSHYSERDWRW